MAKINVEDQWNLFKHKMYPTGNMHPQQEYQLKNTFYSAFGQAFLLMRDTISNLAEDEGVKVLQDLQSQVAAHFQNITGGLN
ncbi:hypothetical protein UFOVP1492_81 [uncultured Caudovirales phage]|uniref:Uncharacterized protein n=1 Tax=uncultured Caudovirales phage TaxID=2100421 RepID=A0A6J5R7Z7_9CAUD|nr:hypothetical protein UFOVP1127_53 [uncultured Caudovirales phage]CAB4193093.1 hypothetical protein UFOVP1242_21 [uncultured Caudovirales phage]CAB4217757.1 hypothetical protein UFOVP1492_81 [uncultured Caudovirales phage]CAB5231579.1 hypothetical protein UFOVP1580_110 [uncultured Caudovirales phage]